MTYIPIILGIAFVLLGVRFLPKLVYELAFFGAIFAAIEWWKYWGAGLDVFGWFTIPPVPEPVFLFGAAFSFTWILLRLIIIFSLFIPQLRIVSAILEGK